MSKAEMIHTTGVITQKASAHLFKVQLESGLEVNAFRAGRLEKPGVRIQIEIGDRVELEMSPYDLTKARIVWRAR
jgi:translation initiation factor IF-1